jgi:ParB-like chromosome segregation protein Spo0J
MTKPLLTAHPLTEQFPEIQGSEFDELAASIKADGPKEPITLFEGMILDGRNRYRACIAAGVEPHFQEFTGDDPVKFVIEKNVLRRHLTASQRAMMAATLATAERGRPQGNGSNLAPLSNAGAAKALKVSGHSVKHAKKVQAKGIPAVRKAVENGKISVSAAAKIADLPEETQHEEVSKAIEAPRKKSKDKKKPPSFKSPGATNAANELKFLSQYSSKIEPAAFVRDCPSQRRKEVEQQIAVVVGWCQDVAAQLKALPPVSDDTMSEIAKLSPEARDTLVEGVERERRN